MNLIFLMNAYQSFQYLFQNQSNYFFRYLFLIISNEICKTSNVHVLYKHEKGLLIIIGEIVVNDVWRIAYLHDCYFSTNSIKRKNISFFHDPDSIESSWRKSSLSFEDFTNSTFTNLFLENKIIVWILLNKFYFFHFLFKFLCRKQLLLFNCHS